MKSKIIDHPQPKVFAPFDLTLTVESEAELAHLSKMFGSTSGHGTYDVYELLLAKSSELA